MLAGLGFALLLPSPAWPVSVQENLWVTDRDVNAIEVVGNTVYLGGSFDRVGPPVGAFGAIDATNGQVLQPYAGVAGVVRVVTPDGSGGWYIGGYFTAVQSQPRSNVAHLDATGAVTSWNPQVEGEVRAIVVTGGRIFIAGWFSSIAGQPRGRLASFDAATGELTSWNPNADAFVSSMLIYGNTAFVGGAFTHLGGTERLYIGAVDINSGLVSSWAPQANGWVYSMALWALPVIPQPIVRIFVGGSFTAIGDHARSRLALLDATAEGSADWGQALDWDPGADATVYTVRLAGSLFSTTVYVGGVFFNVDGQPRDAIAAIDNAGAVTGWNPNASDLGYQSVESLLISGNTIYVGGFFQTIGGVQRNCLAQLDRTSGAVTGWNPHPYASVYALAESGGKVFAGGRFTSIGGVTRRNLAALDATTGAPTAWNPGANGRVHALKSGGGALYVGGDFSVIGGSPNSYLAEIDASGAVTGWRPNPNGSVMALEYRAASPSNIIYLGGAFGNVGGQIRNRLAAVTDDTNAQITSWNPNANGPVRALVLGGGSIYAGGDFSTLGGQPHGCLAKIDFGGVVTSLPPASSRVYALALSGGTLYVGGWFEMVGGQFRKYAGAIDVAAGTVTNWNPIIDGTGSIWDNKVQALAVSGATALVGGAFDQIGFLPRDGFGAVDAVSGAVTNWIPKVFHNGDQPFVSCAKLIGGKLYIGGYFTSVADHPHSGVAAIYLSGLVAVDEPGVEAPAARLRAGPNPFLTTVTLRLALPGARAVDVDVFDVEGRRVRRLQTSGLNPGEQSVTWDGRDDQGRAVAAGVYVARVEAGGRRATAKILRMGDPGGR